MQGYLSPDAVLTTTRKCGVLVADDEPDIRNVLELGLQQEGFSVWLAADGQEALDLYRGHCETIDVVLLDVRMPRLDGPRTLAALQELTPQIPCCFMSGFLGEYTEAELRTQGARAVLEKPFRLPEVAQVLRRLADDGNGSATRAPAQRHSSGTPTTKYEHGAWPENRRTAGSYGSGADGTLNAHGP